MVDAITRVDPEDRASHFEITTHTYKTVGDTPVLTDVFVPKRLAQGAIAEDAKERKLPVIVYLHGGGLVTGSREDLPWFPLWLFELALKHDAIIVSPDHRLLPEATANDALDDLNDFWDWLAHKLDSAMQRSEIGEPIISDLSRVFVIGESAGGYLALQLALEHFKSISGPKIRTVVSSYPMVDLRSAYWTTDYEKSIFGAPQLPNSIIDEFIASVSKSPQPVVTNGSVEPGSPRMALMVALIQRGRILEVMGTERDPTPGKRRLHPEDRVVDGAKLPPILFIQGSEDSVVSPEGTKRFVEHLAKHKAVQGLEEGRKTDEVLKLVVQPGEHMFDNELHIDDREWVKESIAFIEKHWLG